MKVPVLETERLILREYRLSDFPAHSAAWADPRTTKNFGPYVYDEENCWLRFQRNFGQWAMHGYGCWGVEDRATAQYIGAIGYFHAKRAVDLPYRHEPEAGWMLAPDFHGRGLASEALKSVLAWGDAHIDSIQSWCMIAPQNQISQKTAVRFGYRPALDATYKGERVLTFLRPRGGRP